MDIKRYWNTFLSFCGIILVIPVGIVFGIVICAGLWWQEVYDTWRKLP